VARGLIDLAYDLEEVMIAALRADATLLALVANDERRIRQRHTFQDLVVPSVGIFRVADDVVETEIPVILQFDWFAQYDAVGQLTALEVARDMRAATLRVVLSNYTRTVSGIGLWTRYLGTRRNEDPRSGVAHLSGDVEFHPYRTFN
jgi:hypothetical protein